MSAEKIASHEPTAVKRDKNQGHWCSIMKLATTCRMSSVNAVYLPILIYINLMKCKRL